MSLTAWALVAGALMLTTSCAKEKIVDTAPATPAEPVTLVTADLGEMSKISFDDQGNKLALGWQTGDRLRISSGSASEVFTLVDGAGTQSAHFSGSGVAGSSFSISGVPG